LAIGATAHRRTPKIRHVDRHALELARRPNDAAVDAVLRHDVVTRHVHPSVFAIEPRLRVRLGGEPAGQRRVMRTAHHKPAAEQSIAYNPDHRHTFTRWSLANTHAMRPVLIVPPISSP